MSDSALSLRDLCEACMCLAAFEWPGSMVDLSRSLFGLAFQLGTPLFDLCVDLVPRVRHSSTRSAADRCSSPRRAFLRTTEHAPEVTCSTPFAANLPPPPPVSSDPAQREGREGDRVGDGVPPRHGADHLPPEGRGARAPAHPRAGAAGVPAAAEVAAREVEGPSWPARLP